MKNESNGNENTPVSGENETPTRFESTTESEERWLPIPGYEGHYEVSDLGRVRSIKFQRLLVLSQCLRGKRKQMRRYVCLCKDGKVKKRLVHQLVLESFVGHRPNKDFHGCHNNGNSDDNTLSNLRWDTRTANSADRRLHGTTCEGSKNGRAKITEAQAVEIRSRAEAGEACKDLAREYGLSLEIVYRLKARNTWRHV